MQNMLQVRCRHKRSTSNTVSYKENSSSHLQLAMSGTHGTTCCAHAVSHHSSTQECACTTAKHDLRSVEFPTLRFAGPEKAAFYTRKHCKGRVNHAAALQQHESLASAALSSVTAPIAVTGPAAGCAFKRSRCLVLVSRCSTPPGAAVRQTATEQAVDVSVHTHVRQQREVPSRQLLAGQHCHGNIGGVLKPCIYSSMSTVCCPYDQGLCCTCSLTLLVPKPQVGLVDLVDSCWEPLLVYGLAVLGPGLFMPKACFSCSLEMKAAAPQHRHMHTNRMSMNAFKSLTRTHAAGGPDLTFDCDSQTSPSNKIQHRLCQTPSEQQSHPIPLCPVTLTLLAGIPCRLAKRVSRQRLLVAQRLPAHGFVSVVLAGPWKVLGTLHLCGRI